MRTKLMVYLNCTE